MTTSVKAINQMSFLLPTFGIDPSFTTLLDDPDRTKSLNRRIDRPELCESEERFRAAERPVEATSETALRGVGVSDEDQIEFSSRRILELLGAINPCDIKASVQRLRRVKRRRTLSLIPSMRANTSRTFSRSSSAIISFSIERTSRSISTAITRVRSYSTVLASVLLTQPISLARVRSGRERLTDRRYSASTAVISPVASTVCSSRSLVHFLQRREQLPRAS